MQSHATSFGNLLQNNFYQASYGGSFREVRLFRALRKAILRTAPNYSVEELHGARSQVVFSSAPPWTKSVARCELADLCIVWFSPKPQPSARITFMQAKRSCSTHNPCLRKGSTINEQFAGDSTQWHLLHNRPSLLGRFQTFQPPTNLLKDALLPSVASYCVFHELAPQHFSFFYASADAINSSAPLKPGHVQLTATAPLHSVTTSGFVEQKAACCPLVFGCALFSGMIGTPIDHQSAKTKEEKEFRLSVRRWLGSVLATARRGQQIGSVIQTFVDIFEIVVPEVPTLAPARSVFFIQGDAEVNPER